MMEYVPSAVVTSRSIMNVPKTLTPVACLHLQKDSIVREVLPKEILYFAGVPEIHKANAFSPKCLTMQYPEEYVSERKRSLSQLKTAVDENNSS